MTPTVNQDFELFVNGKPLIILSVDQVEGEILLGENSTHSMQRRPPWM